MSTGTGLPTYTIGQLVLAIRATLGSSNQDNIPNSTIIDKINTVWQFHVPQDFTNFALCSLWSFMTEVGVDRYIFPQGNALNIVGQPLLNNSFLFLYDDNQKFFNKNIGTLQNYLIETVTAPASSFSLQLGAQVARGYKDVLGTVVPSVVITAVDINGTQQSLYDYGTGVLTDGGSGYGTVNYYTGAVTAEFASTFEGRIYATYDNSSWTRPTCCLFYNNVLTLRNIPNQPYFVQVQVQLIPAPFTSTNDTIPISTMFQYLHYQTALLIAIEINDESRIRYVQPLAKDATLGVERITYRQSDNRRRSNQFFMPDNINGFGYPYITNPYPASVSQV